MSCKSIYSSRTVEGEWIFMRDWTFSLHFISTLLAFSIRGGAADRLGTKARFDDRERISYRGDLLQLQPELLTPGMKNSWWGSGRDSGEEEGQEEGWRSVRNLVKRELKIHGGVPGSGSLLWAFLVWSLDVTVVNLGFQNAASVNVGDYYCFFACQYCNSVATWTLPLTGCLPLDSFSLFFCCNS